MADAHTPAGPPRPVPPPRHVRRIVPADALTVASPPTLLCLECDPDEKRRVVAAPESGRPYRWRCGRYRRRSPQSLAAAHSAAPGGGVTALAEPGGHAGDPLSKAIALAAPTGATTMLRAMAGTMPRISRHHADPSAGDHAAEPRLSARFFFFYALGTENCRCSLS